MRLPGFTAEASPYKIGEHGGGVARSGRLSYKAADLSDVVAAIEKEVFD